MVPERLDIYETYNPGAIVRILGCNKAPHESFISDDFVWYELILLIDFFSTVHLELVKVIFSPSH